MLALITTDSLVLADPATLKHTPPSLQECETLSSRCTTSAWSQDNDHIFLSDSKHVHRYTLSESQLQKLYTAPPGDSIHCLAAKDKGNALVVGVGSKVHTIEYGSGTGKVIQTFDSHKSTVTTLSLSNDSTLLASTSLSAVHIHNLTLSSHTVLRGVPTSAPIKACAFHPHTRTRLLLGTGKQLLVYDTTRPSGPIKSISLGDATSGEIVAIACSPFSKTLVAAATSGGDVGLMDLDKEKGLIKIVNLKIPLTSLAFTAEGAALYLGTENGKLLVLDLRALDKPPKSIAVGQNGSRIETMSVQKKLKGSAADAKTKAAVPGKNPAAINSTAKAPSTQRNPSNGDTAVHRPLANIKTKAAHSSPVRVRSKMGSISAGVKSPARVAVAAKLKADTGHGSPRKGPVRKPTGTAAKKLFSPVRDPLINSGNIDGGENDDFSVHIESLAAMRKKAIGGSTISKKENLVLDTDDERADFENKLAVPFDSQPFSTGVSQAKSTRPSSRTSARVTSGGAMSDFPSSGGVSRERDGEYLDVVQEKFDSISAHLGAMKNRAVSQATTSSRGSGRSRAGSVLSNASKQGPSTLGSDARSTSSLGVRKEEARSRPGSRAASVISRTGSAISATGVSTRKEQERVSNHDYEDDRRRTPSPELPMPFNDPVTPIPIAKKTAGLGVLGLGTPEVAKWIKAGDYEGKGKQNEGKRVGFMKQCDDTGPSDEEESGSSDVESYEEDREKARERELSMQISPRRPSPPVMIPSPLRDSTPAANSAHDLLRTIMRDVMCDFQQETKAEMMGLHLDLVRMGRGWRSELRGSMDEWGGELQQLREENKRLREENERLRRGY
ncbi:hypothetical protein SERLA73DRAFT_76818 [Serpula lacrymans var. lacrymans S7.3]|uniref:WD40 repeat-like protein n=2 Tax=Serpula lacrymans var. lacrymans TaxID=341189 RepID=F8Q864_SERL3|nr:uncharacterized protein SERLADRAFT_441634 [Serpula lacrymans var. lacrymans S7.9]EGN95752.1 hypothetical protein SERLA73DRAFT_76818 [Serpula lacrymans var. lacrymans S7.3]EGO21277.1 hypothetical protein SERLADRAFT_441634 [Serpula lacrymans var. lacrymans S7.9]